MSLLSFRPARRCLSLVALLFLVGGLRAQPGTTTVQDLEIEARKFKEPTINDLLRGNVVVDPGKEYHRKALELEARLVAYRLFQSDYLQPYNPHPDRPGEINPKSVQSTFLIYESDLNALVKNRPNTDPAAQVFAHAVLEYGKEVLQAEMRNKPAPRPIVLMNTARMMARTADLAQPETADALLEVLRNPPVGNQGAQYWAAKGLHDLLEKSPPGTLKPEQMEKTALALTEFVDRKVTFTPGAPSAEIDGYRTLRREAVRALAQTRVASAGEKGKPAWVLLKVMSATDIVPAPNLDERAEAAIGLARMRQANDKDYCPDYAVQQIVAFVRDFAVEYQKSYKVSGLPMRILAARLGDELKTFNEEVKDDYVAKAVVKVRGVLTDIELTKSVSPESLRDFLVENKAKNQMLFKSDPKTVVGAGAGGQ
jgi:hypothetical protein